MKTLLSLSLLALVLLWACDDEQERNIDFPVTLKARKLILKQDVKVYTKDGEVTDPVVIKRFLEEEPFFRKYMPDEEALQNSGISIRFISENKAVLDMEGKTNPGPKSISSANALRDEEIPKMDFKIDTVEVKKEGDQFNFTYKIYRSADNGTRPGEDRWKVKSAIFPEVREITYATGWGDYRRLEMCYVCGKRVMLQDALLGTLRYCFTQYKPVDLNISEWGKQDTLAFKEYHLVFE